MTMHKKRSNPAVWRDITPVKKTLRATAIRKIKTIKFFKLLRFLWKKFKLKLAKASKKKTITLSVICAMIIVSICGYYFVFNHNEVSKKSQTKITTTSLVKGTPDYTTILPANKTIKDLGGWTRVSPSSSNPVFAYSDKIDDIPVIVSEQPLPDDFKADTANQVAQLAKNFNADEKITVGDTDIYIGTSAKGPQSIIVNKNNLLILIKSSVKIANASWGDYVNSLQ